jgi:type IV pilus assembly protein PilC
MFRLKHIFCAKKVYYWTGIHVSGEKMRGIEQANNHRALENMLTKKNIVLLQKKTVFLHRLKKNIHFKDMQHFLENLCFLLQENISIKDSLTLLAHSQKKKSMQWMIHHIKRDIENGIALSKSLKQFPSLFNTTASALISMSEQSSYLSQTLKKIILHRQNIHDLKRKMLSAAIYPIIVCCTAVIITVLLLIFVVPNFQKIYDSFHIQLPLLTRFLIHTSNILNHHLANLLCMSTGAVTILLLLKKQRIIKKSIEILLIKLPMVKKAVYHYTVHYWYYCLAEMLAAGIPLLTALRRAETTTDLIFYRKKFYLISKVLLEGETFYTALSQSNIMSDEAAAWIKVIEQTGKLHQALHALAKKHYQKLSYFYGHLSKIIEPLMTLFTAGLIAVIVTALYWPIFNLGQVF